MWTSRFLKIQNSNILFLKIIENSNEKEVHWWINYRVGIGRGGGYKRARPGMRFAIIKDVSIWSDGSNLE